MTAEARAWFELAIQRDPRHRPWGFDPTRLTARDDGPAVALSRPVLKASALPPPADRSSPIATRPDSGPRFEEVAERAGVRFRYDPGATPHLFIGDTMGGGVLADERNELSVLERPEALVRTGVSRGGRAPRSALALGSRADLVEGAGRSHSGPPGRGRSRGSNRTPSIEH
jgi:hypothetical protein